MTSIQEPIITEEFIQQPKVEETATEQKQKTKVDESASPLECNICYEESIEPVTTHCGHIFCWSCVYKWIEVKRGNAECPNCKNTITKEKLIPLYPKNYDENKRNSDAPNGVPKRPLASREEERIGFRGSGIFTGVNFRSRNYALTVGCLPTLIPIIMMIVINVFAIFMDSDDDYELTDTDDTHFVGRRSISQQQSAYSEGDGFETETMDWVVIGIMILFVALPFILRRFSRRNY